MDKNLEAAAQQIAGDDGFPGPLEEAVAFLQAHGLHGLASDIERRLTELREALADRQRQPG